MRSAAREPRCPCGAGACASAIGRTRVQGGGRSRAPSLCGEEAQDRARLARTRKRRAYGDADQWRETCARRAGPGDAVRRRQQRCDGRASLPAYVLVECNRGVRTKHGRRDDGAELPPHRVRLCLGAWLGCLRTAVTGLSVVGVSSGGDSPSPAHAASDSVTMTASEAMVLRIHPVERYFTSPPSR